MGNILLEEIVGRERRVPDKYYEFAERTIRCSNYI